MALLRFIVNRITDLLKAVVTLALLAGLIMGWYLLNHGQQDDQVHLAAKRDYLQSLTALNDGRANNHNRPNIVFVLYDDMGYGDIGHGASGLIATPNIDALATAGLSLSNFHAPAPVCTPSRAGFLTGRLGPRAALPNVVFPTGGMKDMILSRLLANGQNTRLPAEEITLADVLQATGYRTGMVGKWHLGDRGPSLPNDMGFEYYFGALYSNDMQPFALYRNTAVAVAAPVDQTQLSELYAAETEQFIQSTDPRQPFFLYLAHSFPHDPLHASAARLGQSNAGLYGDVLEELDEGIGRIVSALQRIDAVDNTLLIISSDNGPWFLGSPGNFRGRKGATFEGGVRVPFIVHWPQGIQAGSHSEAMAMGTDLLPTFLELLQLPAPTDRVLDGRSLLPVLTRGASTPHEYLYHYDGEQLIAVRGPRFKYRGARGVHFGTDQMPVAVMRPQKEWLFDLARDPLESYDVSARHPEALERLRAAFEAKKADMRDNPRGWLTP